MQIIAERNTIEAFKLNWSIRSIIAPSTIIKCIIIQLGYNLIFFVMSYEKRKPHKTKDRKVEVISTHDLWPNCVNQNISKTLRCTSVDSKDCLMKLTTKKEWEKDSINKYQDWHNKYRAPYIMASEDMACWSFIITNVVLSIILYSAMRFQIKIQYQRTWTIQP